MTKLARVICLFFIISFPLIFTSPVFAGFADLLQTIPDGSQLNCHPELVSESHGIPHQVRDDSGCDEIVAPAVTFGDLLNYDAINSNNSPTTDETILTAKTEKLKKLLANLETSYQQELIDFRTKTQNSLTYNLQPTTHNLSTSLEADPQPTPFIPLSTLIDNVSSLTTNNPQLTTIFPTPTISDTLLLATLNDLSQPTTNNPPLDYARGRQPTTNTLGALTQNPPKTYYTIALLGDSMTDTLGRDLPHLRSLLQENFPGKTFSLLNYGFGATDMESGLYRLTETTDYLGTDYPPLLSFKPDILVVESFAYNHWSGEKYDLDRQWVTIAKIADVVREKSPGTKIILGATIAPNKYIFGDGVLNWSKSMKENSTLIIKAYLQNLVNFATSQNYPLADAYHPTLDGNGHGMEQYINSYDHLHPSGEGSRLYSQKIIEAIRENGLIQLD